MIDIDEEIESNAIRIAKAWNYSLMSSITSKKHIVYVEGGVKIYYPCGTRRWISNEFYTDIKYMGIL